jgi:hypothetical protein
VLVNQGALIDIYAQPLMDHLYALVCFDEDGEMIGRLNWSPEASGRLTDGTKLWEYNVAQDVVWHEAFDLLRGSHTVQRHQEARQRLEGAFAWVEVATQ